MAFTRERYTAIQIKECQQYDTDTSKRKYR